MRAEILIVGAGPAGMLLALALARAGVAVRLVERKRERRAGSKALSLSPATLAIFDALGIARPFRARGRALHRATVVFGGTRLAAVDFRRLRSRYDAFVMLPQWETERILDEELRAAGVAPELGITLTGLDASDGEVRASLRDADGRERRDTYRYVVGCDGAKSRVRDALGIAVTGSDMPLHLILADAPLTWDGPRDQAFYFVRDDGFCILLPLDDLHHRIVVGVPRPFDAAREPDFAELCATARAAVGRPLSLGDPIWISSAPCYNRLAATNSHGRVFLAGDAAHLYSPIGGFGMNSAFGDAFNLGWKLAYVMRGHAPATLLDSYADERLRTARELLAVNDRFTSLIARLSRHTRADELAWLPTMANRPFLRQLRYSAAGLTLSYADGPQPLAGRTVVAGALAPFADRLAGAGDGWPRHALVAPPADLTRDDAEAQLQALAARFAPLVRVVVLDGPSALPPGSLALVRPDLVVERVATGAGACSALTEHLHRHYRA